MKDLETRDLLASLSTPPDAPFRALEIGAVDLEIAQNLQAHFGDALHLQITTSSALALARLRRQVGEQITCDFATCDPLDAKSWPVEPFDLIVLPAESAAVPLDRLSATGQIWRRNSADELQLEARPVPTTEPFALTDIQHAYWLGRGATYSMGGVACHVYFEWELDELDPERLQSAWNHLIARHGMLRAVMTPDGMQKILLKVPEYQISRMDLTELEEETAQSQRLSTRQTMSDQVLNAETWPLFDMRLTHMPGRKWCLHLDLDLLIVDVQSFHILLSELELLYRKPETEFAPIEISFPKYLEQLTFEKDAPEYHQDRAWWLDRIDDLPAAPQLPLAGNPDAITDPTFTRLQRRLDPEQWQRLETRAQENGITKSALLLAAFGHVLARWSESAEFTLNLTQFDRRPLHPDVGYLVGDFTSVLLVALSGETPTGFLAHCERSHRSLWQSLTHSRFSGIEVLRERNHRPQGDGVAQMPVVFTSLLGLDIDGLVHRDGGGVMLGEPCHLYTCTPQLWLDHQTMIRNGSLEYNWIITDQVFPTGVAQAMFEAYGAVLDHLATEATDWTNPLPDDLLIPQQLRARAEVNSVTRPLSDDRLESGFWRAVEVTPNAAAVITTSETLTYRALARRVCAFAHALIAGSVQSGDVIGVRFDKGVDQVAAVLAVLSVGAVYVPLAPDLPESRLAIIAESCTMRALLSDSKDVAAGLTVLAPTKAAEFDPASRPTDPDTLAYIIYTSGSTGQPKGVRLTHRAAMNTIADVNDRVAITESDRVFGLSALTFDLSVYDIFGAFSAGAALVLPDPQNLRDPQAWAQQMCHSDVSLWNSVPALLQMLVDYCATTQDPLPQSLRYVLLSGDWIPTDLPDRLHQLAHSVQVAALGGATEAAIWSNWYEPAQAPTGWRSIPYGYPLVNQGYHIFDAQMRPCPDWVEGDLYIVGAGLADGYQNLPEQSAAAFFMHPTTQEPIYATGDRARYRPGAIIEFLGRRDGQIKLNGYRIETEEIACHLRAHPDVDDAVLGLSDGAKGKQLAAWIVLDDQASALASIKELAPDQVQTRWDRAVQAGTDAAQADLDKDALEQLRSFDKLGEEFAVLVMLRCLQSLDLISNETVDLEPKTAISRDYLGLFKNWMHLLEREGWCQISGEQAEFTRPIPTTAELDLKLASYQQQLRRTSNWNDQGALLCDWIFSCIDSLPQVLGGSSHEALAILFPDGDIARAEALYQNNLLAAHLGRLAAKIAAGALGDTAQVLELGAGVGGLTSYVLPILDPVVERYVHSDVSSHFQTVAREKFGEFNSLDMRRYDINQSPQAQGEALNQYDVVMAANVLHNAKDLVPALENVRNLLKPGGFLILGEATRNKALQLVTGSLIEGLHSEFSDDRAGTGLPMLSAEEWAQKLGAAGFGATASWPKDSTPLSGLGQGVIVAQAPSKVQNLDQDAVHRYLSHHLPAYMLPSHYVCIDKMPLSGNGKVDRSALPSIKAAAEVQSPHASTPPKPGAETELAAIWAELLERDDIAREDDFFSLGGDSLLATRLGALLRTRMQVDLPLRILFEAPVLSNQAAALDCSGRSGLSDRVVRLSEGGGPAISLFHASDGFALSYQALAETLPELQLLGLDAPGLTADSAAVETMAELITAHRHALPKPGPEGHHLLGWSMGAHIAWGMARQVFADGEKVASITLIDPSPITPFVAATQSAGDFLLTCALPDHQVELIVQGLSARAIDTLPTAKRLTLWQDVLSRLGLPDSLTGDEASLERFLQVLRANLIAMVKTPPKAIADIETQASVLVLTASERPDSWGAPLSGWEHALPKDLYLHAINADHWTILNSPDCTNLIRSHISGSFTKTNPPE